MTSSLRRKRRTTRPGRTGSARRIASALVGCLLLAGTARAQPGRPPVPAQTPTLQRLHPVSQEGAQPNGDEESLTFPAKDRYGRTTAVSKAEEELGYFPKIELP